MREATTNALRHAQPHCLRIRSSVVADTLIIDVTDDAAVALLDTDIGSGVGTRGMKARAEQIHGSISWDKGTQGGTKVLLRVPLPEIEKVHTPI